jgi:SAM-dependent methyltransferase
MKEHRSKAFWNAAARENAAWYIATRFTSESPEFFESGSRELDHFLREGGLAIGPADRVLEIGSGAGRMTRRIAALAGSVIASDVSGEMLVRAARNLEGAGNVTFVELSGEGDLPFSDASVDAVFSYITMQHVPTAAAQERYFAEAIRVTRPGGWVYMQFRRPGLRLRLLDWVGHISHLARGRRTLNRAWRGSRVSERSLSTAGASAARLEFRSSGRHLWALARVEGAQPH